MLTSLVHDDWMFGCQKEAANEGQPDAFSHDAHTGQPPAVNTSQQASHRSGTPQVSISPEASHGQDVAAQLPVAGGQASVKQPEETAAASQPGQAPGNSNEGARASSQATDKQPDRAMAWQDAGQAALPPPQPQPRFSFSNALLPAPTASDATHDEPAPPGSTLSVHGAPAVPHLKPRFSFSNALPAVPGASTNARQQRAQSLNSQDEEEEAWQAAAEARQRLDASVADWLRHQIRQPQPNPSGCSHLLDPSHAPAAAQEEVDLQSGLISGAAGPQSVGDVGESQNLPSGSAETQGVANGLAAVSVAESVHAQHAGLGTQRRQCDVSKRQQSWQRAGGLPERHFQQAGPQPSIAFQLPAGDTDWMFNITCRATSQSLQQQHQPRQEQQQQQQQQPLLVANAASNDFEADISLPPATAAQERESSGAAVASAASAPTPAPAVHEAAAGPAQQMKQLAGLSARPAQVPHSVKEAVDRFEAWSQPSAPQHQSQTAEETTHAIEHKSGSQQRPVVEPARPQSTEAASSPALSLIDATLAAINASSESGMQRAQRHRSPDSLQAHEQTYTASSSLLGPTAGAAAAELHLQRSSGPSSGSQGLSYTSSLSGQPQSSAAAQRPPLPAKLPQLRMSARPAFTDALAKPALLQRPWPEFSGSPQLSEKNHEHAC